MHIRGFGLAGVNLISSILTMRARLDLSFYTKITLISLGFFLFTACPPQTDPTPADTLMGDKSSPTRPDFSPGDSTGLGPDGRPINFGADGQPLDYGNGSDASLVGRGDSGDLVDPDGGRRGILPSVYFDYDQSFIREDQRSALTETIAYLQGNSGITVLIEGHCDFKGTTEYNLALGDRRASSVRNFLIDSGIPSDNVSIVSKGDLDATEGADDSQRALDRRADIVLYE